MDEPKIDRRRTDTQDKALALLQQKPPMSYAHVARLLGVNGARIRAIAEQSGIAKQRRKEYAVLRTMEQLRKRGSISRAVLQNLSTELQPAELAELTQSLGR